MTRGGGGGERAVRAHDISHSGLLFYFFTLRSWEGKREVPPHFLHFPSPGFRLGGCRPLLQSPPPSALVQGPTESVRKKLKSRKVGLFPQPLAGRHALPPETHMCVSPVTL